VASVRVDVVAAREFYLRHVNGRDARLFDEEAHVYAADVAALYEVGDVVRVGQSVNRLRIGVDLGGDRLQRRKLLHLLDADHVRVALDVAYDERSLVEPLVEGGLRQRGRTPRLAVGDG